MVDNPRRPGKPIASRPLHFIWLVDGSDSMRPEGKAEALNRAMRSIIPVLQEVSLDHPQAVIYMNAIRFGDDARWLVERLTPLSEFHWHDLEPRGLTALGEALTMVGETLGPPLIQGRGLPPILILITDGLPTDDFQAGLSRLLEKPWGRRALRLALSLGQHEEAGPFLRKFVSRDGPPPLTAHDMESLAGQLRWAAVTALKSVCAPELTPAQFSGVATEPAAGGW